MNHFPQKNSTALTALHACIGIGMALAPLLFNFFLVHGVWWMDLALLSLINLILFLFDLAIIPGVKNPPTKKSLFPTYLLLFALISFLYGIIETTFGNWAAIYLYREKGVSLIRANEALAIFWGSLTIGRVLISLITLTTSPRLIYRLLPLFILASLGLIQFGNSFFLAFAVAGLGCSALFPFTISFAQTRFPKSASFSSGLLTATSMIGYGFAAGGGSFFNLQSLYIWLVLIVLIFFSLSFFISHD